MTQRLQIIALAVLVPALVLLAYVALHDGDGGAKDGPVAVPHGDEAEASDPRAPRREGRRGDPESAKPAESAETPERGARVVGLVTGPDGKPVRGAEIRVRRVKDADAAPLVRMTDAAGAFTVTRVPPGEVLVSAYAPGSAVWRTRINAKWGGTETLAIRLEAGAALSGHVLDESGEVVGGVRLRAEIDHPDAETVVAAADGSYRFVGLPVGSILVEADGYARGRARVKVDLSAGAEFVHDITLTTRPSLIGIVTDTAGVGIARAIINASAGENGVFDARQTITAADGRFEVTGCMDLAYTLRCALPEAPTLDAVVEAGRRPGDQEIRLVVPDQKRGAVEVRGRVLGFDDKPLAQASVLLVGAQAPHSPLVRATDAEGRFSFAKAPPDDYTLTVTPPESAPRSFGPKRLERDQVWDAGDIRPIKGGTVAVRFLFDDDEACEFTPIARPLDAQAAGAVTLDPAQGTARSAMLAPGRWELIVNGATAYAETLPFAVQSGVETELEMRVHRGAERRFVLAAPADGGPLRVAFAIKRKDGTAVVEENYEIGAAGIDRTMVLAPGEYVCTVEGGRMSGSAEFTIERTNLAASRIELSLR